jgi:type II secretory ATPase GspE/PulE/Tfp pilus assembly ATPase PilB-like protein
MHNLSKRRIYPQSHTVNNAVGGGMKTLRMSGLTKVKEGVTTIEEVLRVTFGD